MDSARPTLLRLNACIISALLILVAFRPLAAGQAADGAAWTGDLASLHREVARFDFEESQRIPLEMPVHFVRTIAIDQGFPPFGRMRPDNAHASGGRWSFLFECDGGSMAARTASGEIPVLPLADYRVSTTLRTEGLTHARASLAAWFLDAHGEVVPGSRVESPPQQTHGQWTTVTVEMQGGFADATDLIVELQLLQPGQYDPHTQPGQPRLEDVTGRVWFDEVVVWHQPRVDLLNDAPGNVFHAPEVPTFRMRVRDLVNEPLRTRMRIFDLDGNQIFDQTIPAPRGHEPRQYPLPVQQYGWYRVVVDVLRNNAPVSRHWLDIALLPPKRARTEAATGEFGYVLPDLPSEQVQALPGFMKKLDASPLLMPVWPAVARYGDARRNALAQTINHLLRDNHDLIFELRRIPDTDAAALGLEPDQLLDLLGSDVRRWQPLLSDLLIEFGLDVQQWQLGQSDTIDAIEHHDFPDAVLRARASLDQFIPHPEVFVPTPIERVEDVLDVSLAAHVTVPVHVQPSSIADYAAPWSEPSRVMLTLDALDAAQFEPRQVALDLMLRGLHGWRAGIDRQMIEAPWDWNASQPQPTPAVNLWQILSQKLAGFRYAGQLKLDEHVHCWIAAGDDPDHAMLIAWTEHAGAAGQTLRMLLGEGDVTVTDAFGNVSVPERFDEAHVIRLHDMPVFIDGVNLPLALFRSTFTMDDPFIPALHRAHPRHLVLHNPWPVPIAGRIQLHTDEAGLTLSPRTVEFSAAPNAQVRIPLEVVADRSIVAGQRRINADIAINADRRYTLHTHIDVEVGLENIRVLAGFHIAPRGDAQDLIITQYVTNTGKDTLNLTAFLFAPEVSQMRRDIGGLQPGQTVIRRFRIRDGARRLAGRELRIGVSERDGLARLNHVLYIPEALVQQASAP
jgi:hypothetical protein